MPRIDRTALTNAIHNAISVFSAVKVPLAIVDSYELVEKIGSEMRLGISRVPCYVQPEDLRAYLCALLALKAIARCQRNSDRRGILRLLFAAARDIAQYKFREPPLHSSLDFGD